MKIRITGTKNECLAARGYYSELENEIIETVNAREPLPSNEVRRMK